MAIPLLPVPPNRTQEDDEFSNSGDSFFGMLPGWGSAANALGAAMSSIAAGVASSIPYIFDSSTTDADPTPGRLRLSNATQKSATMIRADLTGADTKDWTGVLNSFASSSSVVKGQIRLVKLADASKWLVFEVTALASPAGYKNISVTPLGGSAASPFLHDESILLYFTRSGDAGITTPYMYVRDEKSYGITGGTSVASNINQARAFNTVVANSIVGASLSGNNIILPLGGYRIRARCPAYQVGSHKAFLYNASDATILIAGSSAFASSTAMTDSWVIDDFSIAATKNLAINHWMSGAVANGLGYPCAVTGQNEVYAEAEIWKIS